MRLYGGVNDLHIVFICLVGFSFLLSELNLLKILGITNDKKNFKRNWGADTSSVV